MSSIAPFYLRESPEKKTWRRVLEFPDHIGKLVSEYVGYGKNQSLPEREYLNKVQNAVAKSLYRSHLNYIYRYFNPLIVFLDIDGVLMSRERTEYEKIADQYLKENTIPRTHEEVYKYRKFLTRHFDRSALLCLDTILEAFRNDHIAIVISSSWRIGFSILALREIFSLLRYFVIDKTPENDDQTQRAEEILCYIQEYNVRKFVILDDQNYRFSFYPILKKNFFKVQGNPCLLSYEHAQQAIIHLSHQIT